MVLASSQPCIYRGHARDVIIDLLNCFRHLGRQTRAMADKCNEREIGHQPLHVLPTCLLYLETILCLFRAIPRVLDSAESLVVT